jgi:CRP-like cAMP-binding protein
MNLYLVRLLQENPVFSHLNNEVINKLFDFAVQQNYHSGEILTLAGDIWPFLFMVGDGSITVLKESSEGRGLSIAEFKPVTYFGAQLFFKRKRQSCNNEI